MRQTPRRLGDSWAARFKSLLGSHRRHQHLPSPPRRSEGRSASTCKVAAGRSLYQTKKPKNSKQKLWLFVLYLFDPKVLKMAPGTHNVVTNQMHPMVKLNVEGNFTWARSAFSPVLLLCWSWLA
jgi:hypothetical protein